MAVDPFGHARERRETRGRVAHRVPCELKIELAGRTLELVGRTTNVSASGLSVQVPCSVQPGAPVQASLHMLHGTPMLVRGVVVHARRVLADEYELGIQIKG